MEENKTTIQILFKDGPLKGHSIVASFFHHKDEKFSTLRDWSYGTSFGEFSDEARQRIEKRGVYEVEQF